MGESDCETLRAENDALKQRVAALEQENATLRASEARFRAIATSLPVMVDVVDTQGNIVFWNEECQRVTGYRAEEIVGNPRAMEMLSPDANDHDRTLTEWTQRVMQMGETLTLEEERQREDGTHTYLSVKFPLYDSEGTLHGVGSMTTDITAHKRTEAQLRESENWFRQMLMTLFDSIVVHEEGTIIQVNQVAATMFGYTMDEMVGMGALELIAPESHEIVRRNMVSGAEVMYEAMMQRKDGTTFLGEIQGKMMHTERPLRIASVRDITERKRAEAERDALQQQVIEAQRATLRELSAPLLPISTETVIMPLIGTIDSQRAQLIMETLLEGVAAHRADTAILDITGVHVVDTQVANALVQATRSVRLLGAQVVLTGIGPAMAQTLVHLGVDLSDIVTRGSLQAGIAYAMK